MPNDQYCYMNWMYELHYVIDGLVVNSWGFICWFHHDELFALLLKSFLNKCDYEQWLIVT